MPRCEPNITPYTERWSPARRLLCLCVKASRSELELSTIRRLNAEVGPLVADLATAHRAESIVAHGLADAGIRGTPWDGWHDEWNRRIGRMMGLLDELAARAARLGIPVVALKNGAIARALHPCPGCVPMGDLDLLVRRGDFAPMHDVLVALGFRLVSEGVRASDLRAGLAKGGADYALTLGEETYAIDLQWRPVSGRWLRADQEAGADELIERSAPMPDTAAR